MSKLASRLVATALGCLALACGPGVPPPPAADEVPEYSIEDFLATTNLQGASFSPDASRVLVSSDATGVYNAYAVPTDGGDPARLTHSTDQAVRVVSYFPADERFLYLANQGGDELDHLYVREVDGRVVDLTPGDKLKAAFAGWAQDDRSFFVVSTERDRRFFDVYEVAADGYRRTLFYQDDLGLELADISPDKRYLAFTKPIGTSDSDVLLYDRQTGEMRTVTTHEGPVENVPQVFSPDGRSLYYTTEEGAEFKYLMRYDLASAQRSEVLRTDWDVEYAAFSRLGEYLVVAINRDARNELRLFRPADLAPVPLPELPGLDIERVHFSRDAGALAFYANSSRQPRNLYLYDLQGSAPRLLTRSLSPRIDPRHLADAEVVRLASFDGVEVPGLLYRPLGASPENQVPALVWVHGGPGGQSRMGYDGLLQYLVNHGYAVFAINNRGSSGYGKTFYRMDDRNHGQGDLGDCVAGKQMLAATGWVNPQKIGILGGSYGGYMVLAALTFKPEEFALGVDIFGVSNWERTLASIPPWWETMRRALYQEIGDPAADREYLRRISPLFHARNIVRPLMVLQGANDPRVLKVESDEIVAAAEANGVPVEYLVFDDEGHGFQKKANRERAYRAILEFLDRHLKGTAMGA
jgi:dipeptidyl aminopeptidase/acylaminoacyl peptidase